MTIPDPLYRTKQEVWFAPPCDGEFKVLPCLVCAIYVTIPAKGSVSFSYKLAYKNKSEEWQYGLFVSQEEIFLTKEDCNYYHITKQRQHRDNYGIPSGKAVRGLGEDAD